MQMYNPPHPGEVIQELCFEPLDLSVTKAAEMLDISENTLSQLLHGQVGISPDLAIRLAMAFDTTPESWLWMQVQYDLWQARQNHQYYKVQRLQSNHSQSLEPAY
jgi:addiction module HigA family antidote